MKASAPWPTLLSELGALRDRYIAALQKTEIADRDGDVADAVCSTLEILSDVARVAHTRLEVRALVHAELGDLLHEELVDRIGRREEQPSATK